MTEFFNDLISQLSSLQDTYIYLAIMVVAYLENVFPPIPGDLMIVFAGYLVGMGLIDFPNALLYSTIGSFLGFIHIYGVGRWLGESILSEHKMKFLPKERIREVSKAFGIYGYWLIVGNRFLAGTRAIISLFAGVAKLDLLKTIFFSIISAVLWNSLMIWLGSLLGENWRAVTGYLESYAMIVTGLIVMVAIVFIVRWYLKRKNNPETPENPAV